MSNTDAYNSNLIFNEHKTTSHSTKFGTFNVKKLKYMEDCRPLNNSIYPSTFSTLIPSSELQHVNISLNKTDTITSDYSSNTLLLNISNKKEINNGIVSSVHVDHEFTFNSIRVKFANLLSILRRKVYLSKYNDSQIFNQRLINFTQGDIEQGFAIDANRICILSVSFQTPITIPIFLALFHSYVPFLSFLILFFSFCFTKTSFDLFGMAVCSTVCILNELIIKHIFKESRPNRSAVKSYGMPSSHCMVSYAFLTWIIIESLYASSSYSLSIIKLIFFNLLLLPVPWARLYLEDHTFKQCMFGCLSGFVLGVFAFLFRFSTFPTPLLLSHNDSSIIIS